MLPNLIHPINVTVERLVRGELLMDQDAREPVLGSRTTSSQTWIIPAQIKWSEKEDGMPMEGGTRERDAGYILCRIVDMDAVLGAGQRFGRGDRIIAIGNLTDLDLYINKQEPMGHWQDQNGTTLIRYYFTDRHPTRQKGDL